MGRLRQGWTSSDEATMRAAAAEGRWGDAATLMLRAYGQELLEYLIAVGRSEADGSDAFSLVAEKLWRGLPRFRWESSARTWCYVLSRRALTDVQRAGATARGRHLPLSHPELKAIAAEVHTRTVTYLRTEASDALERLRASLTPQEHELLVLRLDRKLPWREVARVMEGDEALDAAAIERRAAALRKQWEVLKAKMRTLVHQVSGD